MRSTKVPDHVNRITAAILDSAIAVQRSAGRGLLESFYEELLSAALIRRGHAVRRQVNMPGVVDGVSVRLAYRADMIVDDLVLVELKAVEGLHARHFAQVRSYLRLSGLPVALLINFNEPRLIDGFARLEPHSPPHAPTSPADASSARSDELSKG